jgi:transcriptional regulator with XRE-family HTH domain
MKTLFSKRLTELLGENGISKRKLASAVGVSAMSVSDWTNGNVQPTADSIYSIAEFFGVSADYLLGLEDDFGIKKTATISVAPSFSQEEIDLIIKYRQMPEKLKELVREEFAIFDRNHKKAVEDK